MKLQRLSLLVSSAATAAVLAPGTSAQTLVRSVTGPASNAQFGKACIEVPDQNGDGFKDLLIGAPGFNQERGSIWCLSGAYLAFGTGTQMLWVLAPSANQGDQFGYAIADVGDCTGDGCQEFVIAGSRSDAGGTDIGVVKCYRLFPVPPATYCTGKVNSLGCTPAISFTGSPSETSSAPFLISASNFLNQKNGLFFYSHRPTSVAFQGGIKCVRAPFVRGPLLNSGGSTSGSSCTGAYSFDFNAWIQSGVDLSLVTGAEIYTQCWARDPASVSHTSLSNALRFLINP